ncbi:sugar phosphate isomerase/epimerase family protein [Alienimonas californiensis]|uniref:Inosose isomerase n=1 Tax=Alienimonas californiensis TaxID=2527989 RepID=A0A517P4J7_9PLAN|nr:sugar phosphate isomerase/epimerase family protein [Alienimonas californiensis]QDT14293.1 Inosose isomerase [Alienimonas californiensis]
MQRRTLLAAAASAPLVAPWAAGAACLPASPENQFRYCLNTATIRGRKLGIEREVEIAGEAGYQGIEPWIRDIEVYRDAGGSLPDLKKKIADAGLTVDSAIGFAQWIAEDEAVRKAALEQAKREMALLRSIGGTRIAAPPAGATKGPRLDLDAAAERYAALCDVGAEEGVVPQLEVWGFSDNLSKLGEVLYVASEAGRPNAMLLLDAYHLHRGGSGFGGLHLLGPGSMEVFHLNDFPSTPSAEALADKDRVLPGDGDAPLDELFETFQAIGFANFSGNGGTLSLELFNPDLWARDPLAVAKEGLAKMKAVAGAG